jgi:Domain of unknown function (DUF4349)
MRWSERHDDNLEALDGDTKLGAALAELRERRHEPSVALRERVRAIAAEEPDVARPQARRRFAGYRISPARVGALAAALLLVAVAIPAVFSIARSGGDSGGTEAVPSPVTGLQPPPLAREAPPPPPAMAPGPGGPFGGGVPQFEQPPSVAEGQRSSAPRDEAAPLPSQSRAQDYHANIKLHVGGHDELSDAVQSAIRTTRSLGGYVTYVDYGTSGRQDGAAELAVRIPVGRVQDAVARFSQLGTILEQQTEIVDLQGRIDRITRDLQRRRDRIAKLEAELRDPTLSDAARNRLEARLVQARRGLANATRQRAGVIRQSRFAKLDLAFTTEREREAPAPPGRVERMLDDALGVLLAELAIVLFALIVAAPVLLLVALGWLGARTLRRAANDRLLEAS